jgi:hypothetical protein
MGNLYLLKKYAFNLCQLLPKKLQGCERNKYWVEFMMMMKDKPEVCFVRCRPKTTQQ